MTQPGLRPQSAVKQMLAIAIFRLPGTQVDERTLPEIAELIRRNSSFASVKLANNRISCTEFEHYGLELMRLLSSNNIVTVRHLLEPGSPAILSVEVTRVFLPNCHKPSRLITTAACFGCAMQEVSEQIIFLRGAGRMSVSCSFV